MHNKKTIVIDAMCGKGKTSYAIQMINDMYEKEGFKNRKGVIFVTPYLNEVERIISSCPQAEFKQPTNKNTNGSKLTSLKELICKGENIATTHAIFKMLDNEILELINNSGYILILDEVLNVINAVNIGKDDLKILLKSNYCKINDDKSLVWLKEYDDNNYKDIKKMSEIGNIYYYRDKFLFWTITPQSFNVFDEIYILTYLFDGQLQKYFYDMHNVKYDKKSIKKINERYELIEYNEKEEKREDIKKMLNIYEDTNRSKLNSNYSKRITNTQFSATWLNRAQKEDILQIKKNICTYFKNICEAKNKDIFWTTLKDVAPKIKNRGYNTISENLKNKDNFVAHSIRATNEYIDCDSCAYIYNRFMNPYEKSFFEDNGVTVDQDLLAVSDLIQWLFRGCIRKGESMNVYIPSKRMRGLLYKYLNYEI